MPTTDKFLSFITKLSANLNGNNPVRAALFLAQIPNYRLRLTLGLMCTGITRTSEDFYRYNIIYGYDFFRANKHIASPPN